MRRIYIYILAICIILATGAAISVRALSEATCASHAYSYDCFLKHVNAIINDDGAAESLPYVTDFVFPHLGYWQVHMIMHYVGEAAYRKEGDIGKTLAYLQPYGDFTSEGEFLGGFDGFIHGAVSSYFDDASLGTSYPERMQHICGGGLSIGGFTSDEYTCYHAIGHALMYVSGNKASAATALCDSAPSDTAKAGCYYGVFMEDSFLFWPPYHVGVPRPDTAVPSMIDICKTYTGSKARECDQFIGQTYLTIHASKPDMHVAAKECERLSQDRDLCIERMATLFLPPLVNGSKTPARVCAANLDPAYQTLCIDSVQRGIELGFGVRTKPTSPILTRLLALIRAAF